jgi:hypothetical protein
MVHLLKMALAVLAEVDALLQEMMRMVKCVN